MEHKPQSILKFRTSYKVKIDFKNGLFKYGIKNICCYL